MQNEYQKHGDTLTVLASALVTKNTVAAGLPLSGEAAAMGDVIGVVDNSAVLSTDLLALRNKGVFTLPVDATNIAGNSAITAGEKVYFNPATGKLSAETTYTFYGWALAAINAGTLQSQILVKLKH